MKIILERLQLKRPPLVMHTAGVRVNFAGSGIPRRIRQVQGQHEDHPRCG